MHHRTALSDEFRSACAFAQSDQNSRWRILDSQGCSVSVRTTNPASILYKSTADRYRPVSYPDGPITARCRFKKNAYWEDSDKIGVYLKLLLTPLKTVSWGEGWRGGGGGGGGGGRSNFRQIQRLVFSVRRIGLSMLYKRSSSS